MHLNQILTNPILQTPFLLKVMLTNIFLKVFFIIIAVIFQPIGLVVGISTLIMIVTNVLALIAYLLITLISIYQVSLGLSDLVKLRWAKLYSDNNYYFLNIIISINLIFLCFMLFSSDKASSGLGTLYFLTHLLFISDIVSFLNRLL